MSLLDKILETRNAAEAVDPVASPVRERDFAQINPASWRTMVQAIENVYPGQFQVVENAITKSSRNKAGELATLFVVKSTFPVKRTIGVWASGKVYGDGLKLADVMTEYERLIAEPEPA